MQRQHDRPAKDAFTHDAEMYMHLVRRLCHRTCTTHSGYTLVAIVESFALYLLGGQFLLFTRFDPFLQCSDRNTYRPTNTDGWQFSSCNQLIDFCASYPKHLCNLWYAQEEPLWCTFLRAFHWFYLSLWV